MNTLRSEWEGDFMPRAGNNKEDIEDSLAILVESKEIIFYGLITMTASFGHNGKSIATCLVIHHLLRGESLTSVRGVQKNQ